MESNRWASKTYQVFVVTTVVNYVWQVPYYMHFYAVQGRSPAPFAVMFLVTFAWFVVAAYLLYRRRRGGFTTMVAFLVVLVGFYILHNISGAFLADLPLSDPILFIASVLGYLNTVVGVVLLVQLVRVRRRLVAGNSAVVARTSGTGRQLSAAPAGPRRPAPAGRGTEETGERL